MKGSISITVNSISLTMISIHQELNYFQMSIPNKELKKHKCIINHLKISYVMVVGVCIIINFVHTYDIVFFTCTSVIN